MRVIGRSRAEQALEPALRREGAMPRQGEAQNLRSPVRGVVCSTRWVSLTTGTSLRSLVRGNVHAGVRHEALYCNGINPSSARGG